MLSAVTGLVAVTRCPEQDPRRSDDRAAPVLLVSPVIMYRDYELLPRVAALLSGKMAHRIRWSSEVDRAVLVVHDLPRVHYKPFHADWEKVLPEACKQVNTAAAFDEVWLVSFVSPFHDPEVVRVDNRS
jgi:hypothetical protein